MTIGKILIITTMFLFVSPDIQSYTETIDDKELTYYSKYILDEDTLFNEYDFICNSLNEVNILVVKGAKLTIYPGRNISKIVKASSRSLLEEESEEDFSNSDNYKYGLTANIVAIGEGSQIHINGATIIVDCPFSDAIVALKGARIIIKNTTIITKQKYSKGLVSAFYSYVEVLDKTSIRTEGDFSPCIELKNGYADATSSYLYSIGEGSSLIRTFGELETNLFSLIGNATNSQLLVLFGNSKVGIYDCDFTVVGKGVNNADYYKNDINLNNGGIILYQNEDYEGYVCELNIFNSKLYIQNSEIPLISCFDAETTITVDNTNFDFGKIFMRADMIENSKIETKIEITMRNFSFNETKQIIQVGDSNIDYHADERLLEKIQFIKQE